MTVYTEEQLANFYKELPEELKNWVFSEDFEDAFYRILKDNNILDERYEQISILVRNVFLGFLVLEDFQKTLEKEIKLKQDLAKKITQEINRFVFFPVREVLNTMYKIEVRDGPRNEIKEKEIEAKPQENKPAKSDSYLEPME